MVRIKDIKNFIEGNFKYYLYKFVSAPKHITEQYAYRLDKCKDTCIKQKKCKYCGCPPVKKAFNVSSCNDGEIFPDLMNEEQWEYYKKIMKINVD